MYQNKIKDGAQCGEEVDGKLAFLDVFVNNNGCSPNASIFRKRTFTGLLTNYLSFTSFNYKVGFVHVRTLVNRVYKITMTSFCGKMSSL